MVNVLATREEKCLKVILENNIAWQKSVYKWIRQQEHIRTNILR